MPDREILKPFPHEHFAKPLTTPAPQVLPDVIGTQVTPGKGLALGNSGVADPHALGRGDPSSSSYLVGGSGGAVWTPLGAPTLTLPTSPVDNQQALLVDSLAAPTYAWKLQWSATAAKWIYTGGVPYVVTASPESTTSTTYTALATAQSFTTPRAGNYIGRYSWLCQHTSATGIMQGAVFINAVEYWDAWDVSVVANNYQPVAGNTSFLPTSAGDTISLKFKTNTGTVTFGTRFFSIEPTFLT